LAREGRNEKKADSPPGEDTGIASRIANAISDAGYEVTIAGSTHEAAELLAPGGQDVLLISASDDAGDVVLQAEKSGIPSLTFSATGDQMVLFDRHGIARFGQRFPIARLVDYLPSQD
jgi:hypothetical protein